MRGKQRMAERKHAEAEAAGNPSPVPQPSVQPVRAPGKRGPAGLGPRTNYSRVNTGSLPSPADAGAAEALNVMPPREAEPPPKRASAEGDEGSMKGKLQPHMLLQDLVKQAMAGAAARVRRSHEADVQAAKQASAGDPAAEAAAAGADAPPHPEGVDKLAGALEYLADLFKTAAPGNDLPAGVTESKRTDPNPVRPGEGKKTFPLNPPLKKNERYGAGQKLDDDENKPPHFREHMVLRNTSQAKRASAPAGLGQQIKAAAKCASAPDAGKRAAAAPGRTEKNAGFEALVGHFRRTVKQAEDAINPAHITAGPAVPPETSAAEERQAPPVGGAPRGRQDLVSSVDKAINYTRAEAYADRKRDLKTYFTEPALADQTLARAFGATRAAGPKTASAAPKANEAAPPAPAASMKTAAAKALLLKLAAEAADAGT